MGPAAIRAGGIGYNGGHYLRSRLRSYGEFSRLAIMRHNRFECYGMARGGGGAVGGRGVDAEGNVASSPRRAGDDEPRGCLLNARACIFKPSRFNSLWGRRCGGGIRDAATDGGRARAGAEKALVRGEGRLFLQLIWAKRFG